MRLFLKLAHPQEKTALYDRGMNCILYVSWYFLQEHQCKFLMSFKILSHTTFSINSALTVMHNNFNGDELEEYSSFTKNFTQGSHR